MICALSALKCSLISEYGITEQKSICMDSSNVSRGIQGSVAECAALCRAEGSMFAYQRNDSGQCSPLGCECLCIVEAAGNGSCSLQSSSDHDTYSFCRGKFYNKSCRYQVT